MLAPSSQHQQPQAADIDGPGAAAADNEDVIMGEAGAPTGAKDSSSRRSSGGSDHISCSSSDDWAAGGAEEQQQALTQAAAEASSRRVPVLTR